MHITTHKSVHNYNSSSQRMETGIWPGLSSLLGSRHCLKWWVETDKEPPMSSPSVHTLTDWAGGDDPEVKSAWLFLQRTRVSLSAHMFGSSQLPLLAALENPTSSSSLFAPACYAHIQRDIYKQRHTHTPFKKTYTGQRPINRDSNMTDS